MDAASISMLAGSYPAETVCAGRLPVDELARVEQEYREGPTIAALGTGAEVRKLIPCEEWPRYSLAAERASVRAVWSLPLRVREGISGTTDRSGPAGQGWHDPATNAGGTVVGTLNLYTFHPATPPWEEPSADRARLLALQAAAIISGAVALSQDEHVIASLRQALETRTVIGQAQGVLMARQGIDADQAFDILRRASQRTNRKLREMAGEIVAGVRAPEDRSAGDKEHDIGT